MVDNKSEFYHNLINRLIQFRLRWLCRKYNEAVGVDKYLGSKRDSSLFK